MPQHFYKFRAKIWLYSGMAGWHFLTLPVKQANEIRTHFGTMKKGWGSIPINATLGRTTWKTSIFPDKKSGSYVLPLKAEVREKEEIGEGDTVTCSIEIRMS